MRELVLTNKEMDRWVGELTYYLDKHTKNKIDRFYNYVHGELKENCHVFRYPGTTTGCIITDDSSIIQKVIVYEDTKRDFYRGGVEKELSKYVGYKLVYAQTEINWELK